MLKKVLFVNPPNVPFTEKSLLIEPVDILTVASYIESLGHFVRVIDMDVKRMSPADITEVLIDEKPDFVVFCYDYHIPLHTKRALDGVKIMAEYSRQFAKVVLIGKEGTFFPKQFERFVDVIVNGEAETPIANLLEVENWSAESLFAVPGITYFDDGRIVKTVAAKRFDLNLLPRVNRDLVDLSDYIDVRTILSSRGCFGKCSFCPTTKFWGGWTARSAQNVVDEIEYLVRECSAKNVLFLDDNAAVDLGRLGEISRLICEKRLDVCLGFLSRPDSFCKESFQQMFDAGFRWVHFGSESGSLELLKSIGKGVTPKDIQNAIIGAKEIGFRVRTSWILDLVGSSRDDLFKTFDLIKQTLPQEIRLHHLALRPGTILLNAQLGDAENYIHSVKPNSNFCLGGEYLDLEIREFCNEMKEGGYLIISDTKDWSDVDKLKEENPELKFISFCPARYGLNWEE